MKRFTDDVGQRPRSARTAGFVSRARWIGFTAALFATILPFGVTGVGGGAGVARADEVHLENGDVIRGEVIGGDEKAVKVKHAYGAEILVPWDKVSSIATDKPVELKMLDGTRLKGKLEPGPRPKTVTVGTTSTPPVTAELAKVAALNEPPEEAIWTGRIAIGVTIQDGNTRSKTFFGSFDGERRTKQDRIEAHAFYAYGTTKDTTTHEDLLSTKKGFARAQYSYYVLSPLYVYVGGALEYDRFKDLKLRSRGGGGLGYAFIETKHLVARVEAGLEYVNEDFSGDAEDKSFVAARFAGHFEWQATSWLRFGEDVEVFPSLKRFRDFVSRSVSSANVALWKGFGLAGIIIWEHDETPSAGRGRDDATYLITLTYVF